MSDIPKNSINLLSSLLDSIDKKSGKCADLALVENKVTAVSSSSAVKVAANWASFVDATSGKTYYHDYSTNTTQWDKPEGFVELAPAYNITSTISAAEANKQMLAAAQDALNRDYAATASFNRQKGHFANMGSDSYWETVRISLSLV